MPEKTVRIGIVGIGNMGSAHARTLQEGKVRGAELVAICDRDPEAQRRIDGVTRFADSRELVRSKQIDALVVATPHYDHTPISIDGLEQGLHVLVEKPMGVHKADCERMIAAYEKVKARGQIFAEMFNQRTDPRYQKLRQLIQTGELGKIQRVNWIITDWFRSEAYYRSGGWRATWRGEGGGVLLNQCPHQLDLYQWLFGMPQQVRAFCEFGRYHDIEVEDQVTAYLGYADGSSGVFIASTGEAPGTNRLEVAADRGRLVIEGGQISFQRNEVETSSFSGTTEQAFGKPPIWDVTIPVSGHGEQHLGILQNFVDAIRGKAELLAPAVEGIHSVELANAMLFSAMNGTVVELPLDAEAYEDHLQHLIAESRYLKPETLQVESDMTKSF